MATYYGAEPYYGEWNNYICEWSAGLWPLPSIVNLWCVDQNGNVDGNSKLVPPGICVPTADPNVSRPCSCKYNKDGNTNPTTGDPVVVATGGLYEHVTDYEDGDKRLTISRTYRSKAGSDGSVAPVDPIPFGAGDLWHFGFQWDLALSEQYFTYNGEFGTSAPDGSNYGFTLNTDGSVTAYNYGISDITVQFVNPGGGNISYSSILSNGGQFQITTSGGDQILMGLFVPYWSTHYTAARPLQIVYRGGYTWTFNYGTQGQVQSISDNLGRSISISWYYSTVNGSSGSFPRAIQMISMPDGTTLNYTYESYLGTQGNENSFSRLKTYTRSHGGTTVDSDTYNYNDPSSAFLLTSVIDNAGVTFNTWQYDNYGRVTSAQLPNGVDATTLAYSFDANSTHAIRTVTNALGKQTVYTFALPYAGEPVLTSVVGNASTHCLGTTTSLSYDSNNRIASTVDTLSNTTTFTYGTDGRVQTRTDASGTSVQRATTYTWNSSFGVPTQIVKTGDTTNLTYDAAGRLMQRQDLDTTTQSVPYSTNGQTRTWTYGYNTQGLLSSVDGPLSGTSDTTQYGYNALGYLSSVTNALGQETQYTSLNGAGRPLVALDANGVETDYVYDGMGRVTKATANPGSAQLVTTLGYDAVGNLTSVTPPAGQSYTYGYDSSRRLSTTHDSAGDKVQLTRNTLGGITATVTSNSVGTIVRSATASFDELNRRIQSIGALGQVTGYSYDLGDNLVSTTDPLNNEYSNAYDALIRLASTTNPANGVTQFGYDANDRVTAVTDPRNLTTNYTYGGLGDLIQQVSPDTGTTIDVYDPAGNLTQSTDARGASANYTYDYLYRVTSIVYKNSGGVTDQTLVLGYDSGTNGKGRLTSAADANQSTSWTYDALGRVTGKGQTIGSLTKSVGYGYTGGDLTAIVTPSNQVIGYSYNSDHQIVGVTVNGAALLSNVTYQPFGAVDGWSWGNATTSSRSYDTDGRVSQIVSASTTNAYSFDTASRITGITDSSNSALAWTYGYDNLDRITSGVTNVSHKGNTTYGWTYDADGNRLAQTGTAATTFNISASSNQLSSTTGTLSRTYGYNAAGMTSSYGTNTFSYNNRGRMTGVSAGSTTYLYNALGQRIEKAGSGGTTVFVYDEAGHLLGEYTGTGALVEETIWLGDAPVATLRPSGSTVAVYYVHTDHLNTPKKVTRPSDNKLAWRWDQDPFGTAVPNQNPAGLGTFVYNLRFLGQYYDPETGLNQNTFRDYDPATGRYEESDPSGLSGGVNTYSYAGYNPVSYSDPSGLFSLSVGESWSVVNDIPGNHWWGWIPSVGGNHIGLTRGWLADAKCHCSGCGTSWKLNECSAVLDIRVMIEAGLNAGANSFARWAEAEHVADLRAGADKIRQAGAAAESAEQQQTFSSQAACELQSSRAVTAAIRAARDAVSQASAVRDTNGSHNYPLWPF